MKRIIVYMILAMIVSVAGYFIQGCLNDAKIDKLTAECDKKQNIAAEMKQAAELADEQSMKDKAYIDAVFKQIFTFYNLDGFKQARNTAVDYDLPTDFINRFYDATTLSDMYADTMLDVMCEYDSSNIYLLDRDDDFSYYYADVCLNMVKFSGTISLSFFITTDNDVNAERFASIIYFENKRSKQ